MVADRGAAHAILSQADGDLVVMSTHGRTGFDRVLFGSVADKVIRGTTGAVLVIPPHTRAPQDEAEQFGAGAAAAGLRAASWAQEPSGGHGRLLRGRPA